MNALRRKLFPGVAAGAALLIAAAASVSTSPASAATKKRTTTKKKTATTLPATTAAPTTAAPATTAAPTTKANVSKEPVSIGVIGAFTGSVASSTGGGGRVASAWARSINAAGGLNGQPVNLILKDIGDRTGAGIAAAKDLIEKDKVVAIIDADARTDITWIKLAESVNVPVIVTAPFFGAYVSPIAFPIVMAQAASIYSITYEAGQIGTNFGFVYASELASLVPVPIYQAFARANGVNMAVSAAVSLAAPDFTAVCQQLKDAKVDSYTVGGSDDFRDRVVRQCAQQGLNAPIVLIGGSANERWKDTPSFRGLSRAVDTINPSFASGRSALGKAYRSAVQKYESDFVGAVNDNGFAATTWLAGELLQKAASKANGPVTGPNLIAGLRSLKGETLDGSIQPVTYSEKDSTSLPCWFTWQIGAADGQMYRPLNGGKPTCAPPAALAPIDTGFQNAVRPR